MPGCVPGCGTACPVPALAAAQHARPHYIRKGLTASCLLPPQVQDVLKQRGKELGSELRLTDFVRVQVGEGLEQEQKNFADEVAETLRAAA